MLEFVPHNLIRVNELLKKSVPVARDFAIKDPEFARSILDELRQNGSPLVALSITDLNYVYQLSRFCADEEFEDLCVVLKNRMSAHIFYIGWNYCQLYPNDSRAVRLFTIACEWMMQQKPSDFEKTLIGRTGLPWEDMFWRSVEIMRIENRSVNEFCDKYYIANDTDFYNQLVMTYFSRCEKADLLNNEQQLAELIRTTHVDFLRPAIVNYTSKLGFENLPSSIYESILYRISVEKRDDAFGLSPSMLQKIRQQRFGAMLENLHLDQQKVEVYKSISGRVRKVDTLKEDVYALDFERYIVVDQADWAGKAYAYTPNMYNNLVETWRSKDMVDQFWPGVGENDVVSAHDVMLGIQKGAVILLEFQGFDALYTKDFLISTR